jgi:pimeloyl-ACP methyl ester carboxylesterase
MGFQDVAAVVGHDYGSPVAAWCGLTRPDVFRSVVLMSAPFAGVPPLPLNTANEEKPLPPGSPQSIFDELAALPVPRKHYQKYYATRKANEEMWQPPGGVHAFLRAYYHAKSADWKQNAPFPLVAQSAEEWAKLPRYYVMDLDRGMPETVAPEMPSREEVAACEWLTEDELSVYSAEYARTGFQGGLQSYRVKWITALTPERPLFAGRTLDVPTMFIAGKQDWGVHQTPGAYESMKSSACTAFRGAYLVPGAGHWVQQERPEAVLRAILSFLGTG